ncbi:response regulator transcription factor [Paraburkholderia sp. J7]|uniref:response regulator transcription factor n=1 Tax=Paraburkholderia sp. J7 TaxID=2805438 RepID=UPI002AB68A45|nr:response regulator [Paraburkholderia sp. J7]
MTDLEQAVIHIIDDDAAMRTALSRLLRSAGFEARVYASAGDFLVSALDNRPGCILLDLELGGPSGLELQQALLRDSRALPIVFMSAYSDVPRTVKAMKAGAVDFLLKPFERHVLFDAIGTALRANTMQAPVRHPAAVQLADREQVVLRGIAAGLRNKQIAAELGLSERTIKSCRADLMRKVGATSLAELLRRTQAMVSMPA